MLQSLHWTETESTPKYLKYFALATPPPATAYASAPVCDPPPFAAAAKAAKAANPAAVAQHATALAQAPVRVPS